MVHELNSIIVIENGMDACLENEDNKRETNIILEGFLMVEQVFVTNMTCFDRYMPTNTVFPTK